MTNILLITAGRGPVECRDFVIALAPQLIILGQARGLTLSDPVFAAGSASIKVTGDPSVIADLLGTHCVIAKSARRGKQSRKRWYIGVSLHPIADESITIDDKDIEFTVTTARGPGGQHVNKTASAVRLRHRPTGVTVIAQDERSQHANRQRARVRLLEALQRRRVAEAAQAQARRWSAHNGLERGNPVGVWRYGTGSTLRALKR